MQLQKVYNYMNQEYYHRNFYSIDITNKDFKIRTVELDGS